HGIRSIRLRYFNAAGADGDGEIGAWHENDTHLVPLVIEAALGWRDAVGVFGTDYATPDGTAARAYVHVEDLARAHVAALERLLAGGATDAINLGTGQGSSVSEVIAAVERVGKRPVPRHDRPRRPGDPPALVANPSRAREVL